MSGIGSVRSRNRAFRSYLRLNTPRLFVRPRRGHYRLSEGRLSDGGQNGESTPDGGAPARCRFRTKVFGHATVVHADCMEWLRQQERNSIHAVVTDPPYGLVEYSSREQEKLRNGKGGVWRQPPSFDGARRSPPASLHRALSRRHAGPGRVLLALGKASGARTGAGGERRGGRESVAFAYRRRGARRGRAGAEGRDRPAGHDDAWRGPPPRARTTSSRT